MPFVERSANVLSRRPGLADARRFGMAVVLSILAASAGAEDIERAALPRLASLPVTILPETLIGAGRSSNIEVAVYIRQGTGARWLTLGSDSNVFQAELASLITDDAYPHSSAFHLDIIDPQRSPATKLRVVFEAGAKSCLVSHIDNRLVHTFSPGREIRVSSVYYKDTTRLARATTIKTLCTAFNGKLGMLMGAPSSDMLPLTFITYDNGGAKAAVSEMNLDFPTYAW